MRPKNHHVSIHQSHQSVISETTTVNTSITSISHISPPIQLFLLFRSTYYEVQKPPSLNTSISHIRNHQVQYINHINQSYQTTPSYCSDQPTMRSKIHYVSIHQPHQSVILETTRVNTSITSICHIRNHHGQCINHINQSYQKPPESIQRSHQCVISETT